MGRAGIDIHRRVVGRLLHEELCAVAVHDLDKARKRSQASIPEGLKCLRREDEGASSK